MSDKKEFLVVLGVLDEKAQQYLSQFQNLFDKTNLVGCHSRDIPYHVTLGSYAVFDKQNLVYRLDTYCGKQFVLRYNKIGIFPNSVVFAEPDVNSNLMQAHQSFDNNYADGYPYFAHTTLFIGDERTYNDALKLSTNLFKPFVATVVELRLYHCHNQNNTLIFTKKLAPSII